MERCISRIKYKHLAMWLGTVALFLGQPVQAGEIAVAVTAPDSEAPSQLLLIDTDAPEMPLVQLPIDGLLAGETIRAIDLRPANGQVWALTSINRMLILDLETGELDQPGTQIDPSLFSSNQPSGFEFNPAVDRIRLTNAIDDNMRFNPITFLVVDSDGNPGNGITPDTDLAYDAGDPNAGANPQVAAMAHDRNDNDGATGTTLFGIDSTLNILVSQGGEGGAPSPNLGQLFTLGNLGVDVTDLVSFDITRGPDPIANDGSGVAYLVAQVEGETESSLFLVTLHAVEVGEVVGNATMIGEFPGNLITGFTVLSGGAVMTAAPSTQVDEADAQVTITVERLGETLEPASVAFQTVDRTAVAGKDYTPTSGVLNFGVGETSLELVVPLLADEEGEGTEAFALELGPVSGGAVVLTRAHTVEILDDDALDGGPSSAGGCSVASSAGSNRNAGVWAALTLSMVLLAARRHRLSQDILE
jgi:hypothetical protein